MVMLIRNNLDRCLQDDALTWHTSLLSSKKKRSLTLGNDLNEWEEALIAEYKDFASSSHTMKGLGHPHQARGSSPIMKGLSHPQQTQYPTSYQVDISRPQQRDPFEGYRYPLQQHASFASTAPAIEIAFDLELQARQKDEVNSPSDIPALVFTCSHCAAEFYFNNQLHKHLHACKLAPAWKQATSSSYVNRSIATRECGIVDVLIEIKKRIGLAKAFIKEQAPPQKAPLSSKKFSSTSTRLLRKENCY